MHITAAEQAQYRQQGFFTRAAQFSLEELADLRDAADCATTAATLLADSGHSYFLDGKHFVDVDGSTVQFEHAPGSKVIRVLEPAHRHERRIDALIDEPRLADPASDLVGSQELALWTVKLNVKSALHGSGFGWHQDSPYWMHDCAHVDQLPNVMLLLDDQTEHNGCFQIIPGSHRQGILPGTADGSQLGGFFTDPERFDARTAAAMILPAGSLVFFDPHVVHGSPPNRSSTPRRALIFTYQPGGQPTLKIGDIRNVRRQAAAC